jgi:hypothetical protein
MPVLTEKQITRLCRTWQRRLRLRDWRVEVRLAAQEEMGDEQGHVDYDDTELTAKVRLLDGDDRTSEDIERTLIHELLHLRLAAWEVPYGHQPQETAINLLADSLYAGYRRRRKGRDVC